MISINPDQEEDRFSRFELISWWDQRRLSQAKVLVVGAGALGNEVVKNLALNGIGNILVADMDTIENSNLSRSVLFRARNNGSNKASTACAAAQDIYPQMKSQAFVGNVVHDLGLGAYFWADVIIGGLDNREARVAINSGSQFANKTWIDGAIEVLTGVARVFAADDGPCYECTMSAVDWKMLESRRSCALLTREQLNQGKVPTTPTIASIIAGIQVQECVKILHGMESMAGSGFVFNGLTNDSYLVNYQRKPDCYGHEHHQQLQLLAGGAADITVAELLAVARSDLGQRAVVQLSRDIVCGLNCARCQSNEPVFASLGKVSEDQAKCPSCGDLRAPDTLLTLGLDDELNDSTLQQLGIPAFDVVTARCGEKSQSYLLAGDAQTVLGALDRGPLFP